MTLRMDAIALLQTQHAEVEALFEKLADRPSDADWHELRRAMQHHVAEEESEMMRQAERLGASALRDLGRRMEERIQVGEVELRKVAAR